MQLTNVIIRPYLTEKSYTKRAEDKKKYAFIVNVNATKADIKAAFESIFDIAPESVSTMIRKPVATRTGTAHPGWTKAIKIAYITLPKGKDISVSKEEFEAKAKEAGKAQDAKTEGKKTTSTVKVKEVKKADVKVDAKQDAKVETSDKKTAWRKQTNKNH